MTFIRRNLDKHFVMALKSNRNFVEVLTEKTIELFGHILEVVQSEYYVRLDR